MRRIRSRKAIEIEVDEHERLRTRVDNGAESDAAAFEAAGKVLGLGPLEDRAAIHPNQRGDIISGIATGKKPERTSLLEQSLFSHRNHPF